MKQFLLLCFASALLAGCKKSADPPFQGYFRMTLDGTRNITADQIYASTPRITTSLTMDGKWSSSFLEIILKNPKLGETIVSHSENLVFIITDSSHYYTAGGVYNGITGTGKLNMLEINNEYVKGTFEFIASVTYATGTQRKTVTNGEFYIKRNP